MSFKFPRPVRKYLISVQEERKVAGELEYYPVDSRVWKLEREDTLDAVLWSLGLKYEGQAVRYCITVL